MAIDRGEVVLLSGNANMPLALGIAEHLDMELGEAAVSKFPDREVKVKIDADVRGQDIFLVQPLCDTPEVGNSPNDNIMETLIMVDALYRASAHRITVVTPYFGYGRQDRKDEGRAPISAKLVADLLTKAHASRLLGLDFHASQIQGFFDIPVDHLYAAPDFVRYINKRGLDDSVIVAPDSGSIKMAKAYKRRLKTRMAMVDKERLDADTVQVSDHPDEVSFYGNVEGKNAIIVDDICSTAGSLCLAAEVLKDNGAQDIYAAITHPVLCGPAKDRLQKDELIKELWFTDSVPIPDTKRLPNMHVVSIAGLMAKAINRLHHDRSVSALFR